MLFRVSVRARDDEAEPLRARLLELATDGIEELDFDGEVELAAYLTDDRVEDAICAFPGARAEPVSEGWETNWRAFHRPVEVGGLWIGPPWEVPPDASRAVVIDPGRAFGTGGHPTTLLSLELLAASPARGSLLDVGCGSGVLAIAGLRLGFEPVRALDIDPVAVETTLANAEANGVAVEAAVADATTAALPAADVAVVNVLLRPVETILRRLETSVAITSGYLAGELPAHPGWRHAGHVEADGWAADAFARQPPRRRTGERTN